MKLTRFINFVKSILDQNPSIEKLSDIVDIPTFPVSLMIFILSKRLIVINDSSGMTEL